MFIKLCVYVHTWQCHMVDCVDEWGENRNRVPNRVRLHHQIDQALSFFCVCATLKNREWPGNEAKLAPHENYLPYGIMCMLIMCYHGDVM